MYRLPALCFPRPREQLRNLNLERYLVFACEPLHDLPNHITQVFEELRRVLTGESLEVFNECMNAYIKTKGKPRGCDYVEALMVLTSWLRDRCTPEQYELLETLCEISRIAREKAQLRCPRSVLRLHNVT